MASEQMASVQIIPEKSLEQDANDVTVLVKVVTPAGESRAPVDICCVIDISGSMGCAATIQNAQGQTESHGLTQLDVAKHGVRTVIKTLGPQDRLSIVAFDNSVDLVLDLTVMDAQGQQKAETELDNLQERGGTDIWCGLEKGLDVLRLGCEEGGNRLAHMMLLTDGQTMNAPQVVPKLMEYKSRYERLPCTVSTFGFGYNIDSPMLVKIADSGSGTYSFIPDAGFVGTAFVNTMSNLLVTFATDVFLELAAEGGSQILSEIPGHFETMVTDESVRVRLDTLQYGQSRDILVKMNVKTSEEPYLVAKIHYEQAGRKNVEGQVVEANVKDEPNAVEIMTHKYRLQFVDVTTAALPGPIQEGERSVQEFAKAVQNSELKDTKPVKELLEDIVGQTLAAFSRQDWMNKWGRHYIPSLMFAHKLQMCNNFKDPGVQVYGGSLFEEIQTTADDTFNQLPAPQPKRTQYRSSGAAAAAPVSMAAYNDRYAGCIDGSCPVQLANGEVRLVRDLKQGDLIAAPDGGSAEIVCAVRTECLGKTAELVELSENTRLTPYHPVKVHETWQFPQQLAEPKEVQCEAIYSFVLSGSPSLLVGGIPCIGLGHGLNEGAAAHPYFSSPKVLEDLSKLPGFAQGLVHLHSSWIVRDANAGHVIGFKSKGD